MYYPRYENPKFTEILYSKKELNDNSIEKDNNRSLKNYQYMASNYINPMSPYKSLLLYYSTGVGKTLSAISVAENFIKAKKGRVLVLTKNETIEKSFKNQIIKGYPGYATKSDIELINKGGVEAKGPYKTYSDKVDRYYEFMHFETFNNRVQGQVLPTLSGGRGVATLTKLDNYLIIIDEVHNIVKRNNTHDGSGYVSLKKILDNSKNTRLLLLSATPMHDKVEEIFQISNLLNFDRKEYQVESGDVLKHGLLARQPDNLYSITEKGNNFLKNSLKSKVLYLKTDVTNFPSKIEIGERVEYNGTRLNSKLIICQMSRYQSDGYYEVVEKDKGNFGTKIEDASSIIYPPGKDFKIIPRQLIKTEIGKYSIKIFALIENIKKSTGKIFVYSSSVNQSGVELISKCLSANGITNFASITSNTDDKQRHRLISKFNDKNNINGEVLKILIGSKVVSEGITLKEVRQVHIYEPFWNMSGIDQVVGRAIRNGSHDRLEKKYRTVEIFKYCSVPLGKKDNHIDFNESFDVSKYSLSERKDVQIKRVERIIAKSSFGCSLFKARNLTRGEDNSRDCNYTKCNYKCDWEPSSSFNNIDTDTYNSKYHNHEGYAKLKGILKGIFKDNRIYSLVDLKKAISKTDNLLDLEVSIEETLKSLVQKGEIQKSGKYYASNGKKEKNTNVFLRDILNSSGSSNNSAKSSIKSSKSSVKSSNNSAKISGKSSVKSSKNSGKSSVKSPGKTIIIKGKTIELNKIQGIMKNGKFSLIGGGISIKGKACSSMDKASLVFLLESLGIHATGTTDQMCNVLQKKLQS